MQTILSGTFFQCLKNMCSRWILGGWWVATQWRWKGSQVRGKGESWTTNQGVVVFYFFFFFFQNESSHTRRVRKSVLCIRSDPSTLVWPVRTECREGSRFPFWSAFALSAHVRAAAKCNSRTSWQCGRPSGRREAPTPLPLSASFQGNRFHQCRAVGWALFHLTLSQLQLNILLLIFTKKLTRNGWSLVRCAFSSAEEDKQKIQWKTAISSANIVFFANHRASMKCKTNTACGGRRHFDPSSESSQTGRPSLSHGSPVFKVFRGSARTWVNSFSLCRHPKASLLPRSLDKSPPFKYLSDSVGPRDVRPVTGLVSCCA